MKITYILKRDGRKQKYDRGKITMAIWKSLFAIDKTTEKFAKLPTGDEQFRKLLTEAAELVVSEKELNKQSPEWKEAERLAKIVENTLIRSNGSHRWQVEEIQDVVEQVLLAAGRQDAAKAYILYRNRRSAQRKVSDTLALEVSDTLRLGMSENAYAAMAKRYLWKDKDGNVIETPKQAMVRVADCVSNSEIQNSEFPGLASARPRAGRIQNYKSKVKSQKYWRNKYLEIITSFEFVPAGCYFRGAGNKQNGSLANCFVLPVEDSIEKIFDAVKWAALIHQMGGGVGYNFSHLRPRGDAIKSGGLASGPINFMKAFDAETQIVMQGGQHRGANMGILNIDHPDIFEFIRAKSVDGEIANFNISVGVFDGFMRAVNDGKDWALINPRDKTTVQRIPARGLWDEMVNLAHSTGDPGMIYLDTINRYNPIMKALGPIEATNVCGEQVLHPFDVCFAEETRILTSHGYEEAADIYRRQNLGRRILVATHLNGQGNEIILRAAKVIKTGKKKTVKVTLWNGQQIRVTPNHEIYTRDGWKPAGKLTDADYVMIQNRMGGELVFDVPNEDLQLHHLFGWFSGDGWFTNGSCGLTFGPQDTFAFDYLLPLWQEFSEYQHRVNIQKNFVRCLASQKRAVMEKFRNFGFTPAKAFDKRVPASVMIATKQRQIAYLQGLFAADGSVVRNKPAVTLTSASYNLLRDVQLLLLNLGIHSHIRHYYGDRPTGRAWAILQVSGESFRRFMDLIGFPLTPYKQLKAENHVSRRTYRNRQFIQVRSIEPAGITEVYDVSEPKTNSLIAEGMVVHNCNLGSVNLSKFVIEPFWEKDKSKIKNQISNIHIKNQIEKNIRWEKLEEVVRTAVRFLDDGIDASTYPIPQIADMAHRLRRIGLGIMGWADMLVKLGVRYDSDEGIKLAEKIMKFIQQISWDESEKLAKEKTTFPLWKESYFNSKENPFRKIRKVRNVAVTTIAPTGTISMIADCSSGIEPYFALEYTKNVVEKQGLKYTNRYYEEAKKSIAVIGSRLSVVGYKSIGYQLTSPKPANRKQTNLIPTTENGKLITEIFRTAHDISPDWHVKMQAAFQKYTDNAVSKTINFSSAATVKDVESAYLLAWKLGCKGITVYRDGSREGQILKAKGDTGTDSLSPWPLALSPKLMQSQMTITPLSQRAYKYERLQIVEESIDGHCPECGSLMEESEGCSLCRNCGYSKCSL